MVQTAGTVRHGSSQLMLLVVLVLIVLWSYLHLSRLWVYLHHLGHVYVC